MALTATANGSTTTFVDIRRLAAAREALIGRQWVGTSGSNDGVVRTVTGGTTTLTLDAAVTSTLTGDTADLYNKRGTGWLYEEYNRVVAQCIDEAAAWALVEVRVDVAGTFAFDTPEVTVDDSLSEVYAVEWEDSDGFWHRLPRAQSINGSGWYPDPGAGQIRIEGDPARAADGNSLRLLGYGRQAALADDTSATCLLDVQWMVYAACAKLLWRAMGRDPANDNKILAYEKKAEQAKRRMGIIRHPDARPVRAY